VVSAAFVDYLHLARFDQRWLIVNVLWEPRHATAATQLDSLAELPDALE
jgi:Putative lumazine-binding